MVRYLLQRPIAVLTCFFACIITGLVLMNKVPVSLLPAIDVPGIVIRCNYANTPAPVMEQQIIKPVRESLRNLNKLTNIESQAANHTGMVSLTFSHGTNMALAYIEVNEKLDRISQSLPRDMLRPQVMRINTADIPVLRIQVIPKREEKIAEASELTEKVLKRRIEQLDGVSRVDINGRLRFGLVVIPNKEMLVALGVNESLIVQAIKSAGEELGGLSVREGQHRYFVTLSSELQTLAQVEALPVKLNTGIVIPLKRLASIRQEMIPPTGAHLFNGREGLVITVQKQEHSRMNELVPKLKKVVAGFKKEYPDNDFVITQDQTFLLHAGISNLYQDIIIGGILTIILLLLFLGNWAAVIVMSINIPASLILTCILFYLFHLSFNIISLSGLALGIGMLIDNSIVVIDNITRRLGKGVNKVEGFVKGTNEVIPAVISQVLTTIAVYSPLILLNGRAGSLVTDQSIALTISLCVSLLVAFIVSPLLYKLLLQRAPEKLKNDTPFYKWVEKGYHRMIDHIMMHRLTYFLISLGIMPLGILLAMKLPVTALPAIKKTESQVLIDWNAPIDAKENLRRVKALLLNMPSQRIVSEAEVGIQQFLVQQDQYNIENAVIYYACSEQKDKERTDKLIRARIKKQHPEAFVEIMDAPNAFTRLFYDDRPYLEARFQPITAENKKAVPELTKMLKQIGQPYEPGTGLAVQKNMEVVLNQERMALYNVSRSVIEDRLQQLHGYYSIAAPNNLGEVTSIQMQWPADSGKMNTMITSGDLQLYPLSTFMQLNAATQPKFITSDRSGPYKSVSFSQHTKDIETLQAHVRRLAATNNYTVEFKGAYFDNKVQLQQLGFVFLIVLLLLYVILAIQYEDLVLPFIVMLTIPLGITGGMFLLWVTGGTLNTMAAIGFIVVLGLIVDDPTLKVDVMNRLLKQYKEKGYQKDATTLHRLIHEAGSICLKPLLMVSLTTSIAMVPVVIIGGLGNDLQKPLAYVIIGGLTIGTFFTTWFIPLAYWYINKWRK